MQICFNEGINFCCRCCFPVLRRALTTFEFYVGDILEFSWGLEWSNFKPYLCLVWFFPPTDYIVFQLLQIRSLRSILTLTCIILLLAASEISHCMYLRLSWNLSLRVFANTLLFFAVKFNLDLEIRVICNLCCL